MKSKEELNALKDEVETLSGKLNELTDEELAQVSGGRNNSPGNPCPYCNTPLVYGGYQEEGNVHYCLCPNKDCPMNIEWSMSHPSYLPWKLYYT